MRLKCDKLAPNQNHKMNPYYHYTFGKIYFNVAGTDHHSESNISILVANEYLIWKKWIHGCTFLKLLIPSKDWSFNWKWTCLISCLTAQVWLNSSLLATPNLSCMHNFKTDFALKFRNIYIGNFAHYSVLFIIIHF